MNKLALLIASFVTMLCPQGLCAQENSRQVLTLDQLFAMTFSDLLSLRQFLEIQRSYKEEIAYNELRRAGKM